MKGLETSHIFASASPVLKTLMFQLNFCCKTCRAFGKIQDVGGIELSEEKSLIFTGERFPISVSHIFFIYTIPPQKNKNPASIKT